MKIYKSSLNCIFMGDLNWYFKLKEIMNPVFTQEQFKEYIKRHKQKLKFYKKFIKGKKILDLGCGFGYSAVSLSYLGYNLVAVDNNEKVIKIIKQNAKNFGREIKIIKDDVFNINKKFKKNSFDACISGGLLEHFRIKDIQKLIRKQFYLAPIVIIDIPICSKKSKLKDYYQNFSKKICKDGVYRNLWNKNYWINHFLKDFEVIYSKVSLSSKNTGRFEKLTLVLKK